MNELGSYERMTKAEQRDFLRQPSGARTLTEARATIARLEADAARYFRDGEAARERVRVLAGYTHHRRDCPRGQRTGGVCDCGLAAILAEMEETR